MGYQVILRQGAIDDLAEIISYISRESPKAAERKGKQLVAAAESLAEMPHRGMAVLGRTGIRRIIQRPYVILYEIDEPGQTVEVLRFWHSSRDRSTLKLRK